MIAYYAYDENKDTDTIFLPDEGCSVAVDTVIFQTFISASPDFSSWKGNACGGLSPDDFGTVAATRDDQGDVCVLRKEIWRKRMEHHLGRIEPGQKPVS